MVNRLAFRLLGSDMELDDVVQDSFAAALGSLGRMSGMDFKAWLTSLVCRTCFKVLRRRRLLTRLGLREEAVDLELVVSKTAPPDIAIELKDLYSRLVKLPAELRVALVLRRVEGLSMEEVSQATGASIATVKRRIAEGEKRLTT
jgi:RNA polymerase sigma-70 factor (ECF subfamily)